MSISPEPNSSTPSILLPINQFMIFSHVNFLVLFLLSSVFSPTETDYLENAWKAQGAIGSDQFVALVYEEQLNQLGHDVEPWATSTYFISGEAWIQKDRLLKQDSLTSSRGRKFASKTEFSGDVLLHLDYGEAEIQAVTQEEVTIQQLNTARYSPINLLHYVREHQADVEMELTETEAVYSLLIGNYPVKIYINKMSNLVEKITRLGHHELYGDVLTSYLYSAYQEREGLTYPSRVKIEKINGNVVDRVAISDMKITSDQIHLLDKPEDYQLVEPEEEAVAEIKTSRHNDYLYFIDMVHTDDRILVVEFEEYFLVAEAPINSQNGELIIEEVRKINPDKPIKYFVFGHHHPHYLGGLRAFVHKGATILCTDISKEYVEYIAGASHSIQPDSLHLDPQPLVTQVVRDSLVIGEEQQMKIYFMGEQSAHTKDYLIYYFPNEKLLFQDDLCWIPKEGEITKARSRQEGLYNIIVELGLEVDTIIQSWPVESHQVKTVIPFEELEASVKVE